MIPRLARQRMLDLRSIHPEMRYYGVVPNEDGLVTAAMAAWVPSYVACGWDQAGGFEAGMTAVHELGHCYGRWHSTFCGAVAPDGAEPYPYPEGKIGGTPDRPGAPAERYFGWDIVRRVAYPGNDYYDFMSYCWPRL
ncbi:MAG: hypothetical protein N3C12_07275 [Candidatus Binatia bacterium]|nr:hypothetical protein [Candidatus Binatia bacterium]